MNPEDIEVFADGNMTAIIRRGNEVERSLPPGWQASHAVLRHLESKAFPYSPRVLRHDETREWLTYMPGRSLPSDLEGHREIDLLDQVGKIIRLYHDAISDFVPPADISWGPSIRGDEPFDVICHNDIAPWNVIVDDATTITGLIDWDLVCPGPRSWDLAYAAWRFGLLLPGDEFGTVADRADRILRILDAYGYPFADRKGFIDVIIERAQNGFDVVEILGRQGVPGYATLYKKGAHHWGVPSMKWIDQHRLELIARVETS